MNLKTNRTMQYKITQYRTQWSKTEENKRHQWQIIIFKARMKSDNGQGYWLITRLTKKQINLIIVNYMNKTQFIFGFA